VYERPRIGGDVCDGSFAETTLLRVGGRFCAFFSGPEIPFPGNGDRERQRLGSNAVTPKEVRASDAAETTRRAFRRGGPLPCHEAAGPRWLRSRDRAPGRQARSSC